jgi:hypothetical protein
MKARQSNAALPGGPIRRGATTVVTSALPIAALTMAVLWLALAPSALSAPTATPATSPPPVRSAATATLAQCVTSSEQTERSATFMGEMTAVPGAAKMEMRIDVLERMPKELVFHIVNAPGLGVWRAAAAGVKSYKYLKEITNLAAPASYRAVVRFRWLSSRGRLVRSMELRTPRCQQPLTPAPPRPREEATAPPA